MDQVKEGTQAILPHLPLPYFKWEKLGALKPFSIFALSFMLPSTYHSITQQL